MTYLRIYLSSIRPHNMSLKKDRPIMGGPFSMDESRIPQTSIILHKRSDICQVVQDQLFNITLFIRACS